MSDGTGVPLFVLSFRYRDELAAAAARAGWHAVAARRPEGLERRFMASGASIAIVDARGALEEGLSAISRLADAVEVNRGALLALISRGEIAALDRVLGAGATHYLASPFGEDELGQALRFVLRHIERVDPARPRRLTGREGQVWRWRPGSRTVAVDQVTRRRLGLPATEMLTRGALLSRLDPAARRAALRAIARTCGGGGGAAFTCSDPRGDGRLAHHLALDPASGEVVGRVEAIGATESASDGVDPLTRLLHAAAGRQRLSAELGRFGATVLLVGLSRFDTINDAFGRPVGDALLSAVARRIDAIVSRQRHAFAARIAGAEFMVVLPLAADAALIAQTLIEALSRPFVAGDHLIPLSARIGIAAQEGAEDADHLLHRASAALADAREGEGARVRTASAPAEQAAASSLEVDLRRALDEDRIDILFQPQVAVASGEIVGVEALARWRHPDRGEIDAATLFAVAARSDYTLQLSQHIQRRALTAVASWPSTMRELRIAINVTAADLARSDFVTTFAASVRLSGLDPGRVTVELTEESLVGDLAAAAAALAALRAAGLRTAIDDFGTGYSSLAYLKALPLDYLKVDRSLVIDIAGTPRDRIVVRGLIDMARSLDLLVIAEGVETGEQLALLAAAGCNLYQGYLCSGPVDSPALERLLANRKE